MKYLIIILLILLLLIIHNSSKREKFSEFSNLIFSNYLSEKNIINLKKGQKIMTEMFNKFNTICSNHNIKYWCLGGTLIGSIRHKGWIPWDGDIDLGMLEEDYNKFKKYAYELPNNIIFSEPKDKPCSKLRSTDAIYIYSNFGNNWDLDLGLQIDIFIFKREKDVIKGNAAICGIPDKNIRLYQDIFPLKTLRFENINVYVPNNYRNISKEIWGNCVPKLLPIKKRFPHEGNIKIFYKSKTYVKDNFEIYSKNDKFYPNYKIDLIKKNKFLMLLKYGDNFFNKHNINYSLFYGTLLGFIRNKKFIPYDHDLDCVVGKESYNKLLSLGTDTNVKDVIFNDEIIKYKPNFKLQKIYLILNKSLLTNLGYGKRFNCSGFDTPNHEDRCSFNGLVGRFILGNIEYDIFPYNNDYNILKKNNFYPNNHNIMSILEKTEISIMENIRVRVISYTNSLKFLKTRYGDNFMIPDK